MALLLDGSGSITGLSAGGLPDSSITSDDIATGAVTQTKIADGAITSAKLDTTSSQLFGMRNRIINGAMAVDQRNAGATVTPTASAYTLDRWEATVSAASKYSVYQNANSTASYVATGQYYSLGVNSLSSYTVGASEAFTITQYIEGYNVADMMFGTSGAKTFTLSFWVNSTVTGTFGGAFQNSGRTRSYPFTYTISAANTWEYKTITVAGDTSGTWLTTNGRGLNVIFSIGSGSTLSGTAGSWATATYYSATGATNLLATNAAYLYITGVQIEKGSTATPFEYRPYGQELNLSQRYYYKTTPLTGNQPAHNVLGSLSTTRSISMQGYSLPVTMRSSPTVGYNSMQITNASTSVISSTISSITCYNTTTAQTNVTLDISYSAGGASNAIYALSANNSGSYLDFSAEL